MDDYSIIQHALKLSGLTHNQLIAFSMKLEGWKQREIADEMGISQPAVSKHIRCAKSKLEAIAPQINITMSNV